MKELGEEKGCVFPGEALGSCAGWGRTLGAGIRAAPSVLVLNQTEVPDLFPISQQEDEISDKYSSPWAAAESCWWEEEEH